MVDRAKTADTPVFRGILAFLIFVFFCLLFAPPELASRYDWLRSFQVEMRGLLHLD